MKKKSFLLSFAAAASLAAFLLFGCGKKGPLSVAPYLSLPAPTALSASQAKDILALHWSFAGKHIRFFMVERRQEGGAFAEIADPKHTSLADLIDPGKQYEYRIRAISKVDVPGYPAYIRIKTIVPPGPPQGLGFSIQTDRVQIKWASPPAIGNEKILFQVYRQTGGPGAGAALVTPAPVQETCFTDMPEPRQIVTYKIVSFINGPVPCEGDAASVSITPGDYVPSKAAQPQGAVISNGVMLVWAPNPETWVQGYRVYKETNGAFRPVGNRTIPSFLDLGSRSGRYRVTALGPVKESPPSDPVSVR
ncbi:MAG: hypothetical protein M0018_05550 [Nitrospiraceae bacterium]|nr:hypothetical protein [Nitrospiraceae bacterium]